MSGPLVPEEVVLVDDNVDEEFHDAVRSLGKAWVAPSGRRYLLSLSGRRLVVSSPGATELTPAAPSSAVDGDLLALGQAIYDARGGEWAEVRLEQLATVWSGAGRFGPTGNRGAEPA